MMENNLNEYRSELQVAISTLVAGLGFYKAQELTDFIHSIKNVSGLTVLSDITSVLFPFVGFILYFGYLLCVAYSLFCIYKQNRPKQHQTSILFAVSCYFGLQILMIGIIWNEKQDIQNLSKTVVIRIDSLNFYIPYDSVSVQK